MENRNRWRLETIQAAARVPLAMSVVLEPGVVEIVDHGEDIDPDRDPCHLYDNTSLSASEHTLCGMHNTLDSHNGLHSFSDIAKHNWSPGVMSCTICGAPICMDCLLTAHAKTNEPRDGWRTA